MLPEMFRSCPWLRKFIDKGTANLKKIKEELLNDMKKAEEDAVTGIQILDTLDLESLRSGFWLKSRPKLRKKYNQRVKALSTISDCLITIKFIDKVTKDNSLDYIVFSESTDIGEMKVGPIEGSLIEEKENLVDVVGDEITHQIAGWSRNAKAGQSQVLTVDKFFERPIPITTFQIAVGGSVSLALPIWDLITLVPSVRAKLRNYAFLRANLNVRIAISGTPFHYGRLLVSYQPMPDTNGTLVALNQNVSFDAGYRKLLLAYLSQAPGAVTMDVRDNKPADMKCPYISTKPMFRLFNGVGAVGAATSFNDIADAGELYIYSLNPVGCVSPTPSEISVYVYAWLSEVDLGAPTGTQIAITTESDDIDEREVGPVERWATSAAKFTSSMIAVPYLSPYAKASSMVANAIAGVSAIFGWSKPIMLGEPRLVKNVAFQNGAQVIGYDTNYKISLDPKQELSVSPDVMGDGSDELSFKSLYQRESYLTTFTWADTDAAMGSPIFYCAVSPYLSAYYINLRNNYLPTPMAFVAAPFTAWRGVIKFRIDIVCSQFHRGKLAIFFEPDLMQYAIISAVQSTNKQFMKVIDIQETQSVEFCVQWAAPREWLTSGGRNLSKISYPTISSSIGENCNGYIGITPLTTLQSPDDSDIEVNVFVCAEELEVNHLTEIFLPNERLLLTESGDLYDKGVTCMNLNDSSASVEHICEDYFGERPVSFRSMLKRYCFTSEVNLAADATASKAAKFILPIIPDNQLTYGGGVLTDPLDMLSYLRYAYVGIRGGIRKRVTLFGANIPGALQIARVGLEAWAAPAAKSSSYLTVPQKTSLRGYITMVPNSNGGLEVELPFYTNNLFLFSYADNLTGPNTSGSVFPSWVSNYLVAIDQIGSNPDLVLTEESATAEDFTFLRFQGCPMHTT